MLSVDSRIKVHTGIWKDGRDCVVLFCTSMQRQSENWEKAVDYKRRLNIWIRKGVKITSTIFPSLKVAFLQPAWHAEKYVLPSTPHTGENLSLLQLHVVLHAGWKSASPSLLELIPAKSSMGHPINIRIPIPEWKHFKLHSEANCLQLHKVATYRGRTRQLWKLSTRRQTSRSAWTLK